MTETLNDHNSKLVGLLAQFDDPESLLHACNETRLAGYTATDAYTPFPVHGIDPALGIKRTILPFIVLVVALSAVAVGLGMQWYTNGGSIFGVSTDESPLFPGYRFKISGKPYFSLPANIPVTFEVIVLSSAFATFFGMWFMNLLPMLSNPLHRVSRFKRATNDKFFLMIQKRDPKFDRRQTEAQLHEWGAVAIDECRQDITDAKLPGFLKLAGILGAMLLLLPPVMIFRAKGMVNRHPRLHVVPDMDWQDKEKPQVMSPTIDSSGDYIFADLRAMRLPVPGSIARGNLKTDTEYNFGFKQDWTPKVTSVSTPTGSVRTSTASPQVVQAADVEDLSKYVTSFPENVVINDETIARGQQRFNIYCSVCHGYAGNGDGLVNQRAVALGASGQAQWTAAKSLHDATVKDPEKNPIGRIFDTITHGRSTMGPYGDQIPVADRWLIVAYVKALQETGIEPPTAAAPADAGKAKAGSSTKPTP